MPLRHRFVARGSAVMLMGQDGQRAILDMQTRSLIADDEPTGSAWNDMLEAISAELPTQDEPPAEQPPAFEP